MSLLSEVALLKEQHVNEDAPWRYTDQRDKARIWGPDGDEVATVWDNLGMDISSEARAKFIVNMQNAAPAMLDVLRGFQAGDAMHINLALAALEYSRTAFLCGSTTSEDVDAASSMLRRMQAMATRMEAEQ